MAHVFHLPLSELIAPSRLKLHLFRGDRPYWAITVSDLVQRESDTSGTKIAGGLQDDLAVWGLSGWYLSLLMKILGVY